MAQLLENCKTIQKFKRSLSPFSIERLFHSHTELMLQCRTVSLKIGHKTRNLSLHEKSDKIKLFNYFK